MADPHQALGQNVHQEASDELLPGQTHCLGGVAVPVVGVSEDHLPVVDLQNTSVADGNPVGVARQVAHHAGSVIKTMFAVHHPLNRHQAVEQIVNFPRPGHTAKFAACCRLAEQRHHLTPEVARQGPDREQIVAPGRMPLPVAAQSPAGDQTMQVDMLTKVLPPSVQCSRHAHLAIQPLRVLPEGPERSPDGLEQQPIDQLGMQLYPAIEMVWQGENDMEVPHRDEIVLATLRPPACGAALALRTMPITATMVPMLLAIALITN